MARILTNTKERKTVSKGETYIYDKKEPEYLDGVKFQYIVMSNELDAQSYCDTLEHATLLADAINAKLAYRATSGPIATVGWQIACNGKVFITDEEFVAKAFRKEGSVVLGLVVRDSQSDVADAFAKGYAGGREAAQRVMSELEEFSDTKWRDAVIAACVNAGMPDSDAHPRALVPTLINRVKADAVRSNVGPNAREEATYLVKSESEKIDYTAAWIQRASNAENILRGLLKVLDDSDLTKISVKPTRSRSKASMRIERFKRNMGQLSIDIKQIAGNNNPETHKRWAARIDQVLADFQNGSVGDDD